MAAEGLLAAERLVAIDRRLDEIDRALLGLLPRAERLAVMANVEERLSALGDEAPISAATAVDSPVMSISSSGARVRSRRSRLAFSAGVLGIVAAVTLLISPLLFVVLSLVSEAVGEFIAISMMAMFSLLLVAGGFYAVSGGGVSLFRLAGRHQTSTGMGWAITGLCTGAIPMMFGLCFLLSVAAPLVESQFVEVTWNAAPAGPVPVAGYVQSVDYPQAAMLPASPYGAMPVMPNSGMPVPPLPSQLPPPLPPDARAPIKPEHTPATKPETAKEPEQAPLPPTSRTEEKKPEPAEFED